MSETCPDCEEYRQVTRQADAYAIRASSETARMTAELAAAEAERDRLRAIMGRMCRWVVDDIACCCYVPPVPSDSHEDVCTEMRAALAGSTSAPDADSCTEDRHIVLPSGEACICGDNQTDRLL